LVTASTQDEDDPTIDDGLVRALMAFPLLETSKQLCVEFLGIYIRSIKLEETTRLDYSSSRLTDHSLEALLAYVGMRIHAIPHPKQLGFRIAPPFFNMWVYTAELKDDVAHLLPRQVKRLWTLHEKNGVTSDKLYIKMTYSEPAELIASLASTSMTIRSSTLTHLFYTNYWLHKFDIITAKISISNRSASTQAMNDMVSSAGAQINEYRVSKMRDLQRNCTPAESILLESVLNDEVAPFWDQRCVPRLVYTTPRYRYRYRYRTLGGHGRAVQCSSSVRPRRVVARSRLRYRRLERLVGQQLRALHHVHQVISSTLKSLLPAQRRFPTSCSRLRSQPQQRENPWKLWYS